MTHPKAILIKLLKSIGVYSWQGVIGYIVGAMILAYGGIFYSQILNYATLFLNIKTPLWATIALIVLCCLYTYIKVAQILSKLNQAGQPSKSPPCKTILFTIDDLKWNTKIYDDGHFEVDRISICLQHDLTLIRANIDYYCPEYIKKNCNIMIDHIQYDLLYVTAKSYIDKEIRNKKC